jgi:hypothetical protein
MNLKPHRKPITDSAVDSTKEIFHLGFAVAPVIASIVATVIGANIHLAIELAFIAVVIVFNFCILWLRSKTEENKELSLFYTFRTNNLRPNQSGDEQAYNVEVAVIESEDSSYFRDNLQRKFKTELDLEKLKGLLSRESKLKGQRLGGQSVENLVVGEVKDRDLYFKPVYIPPPQKTDAEELQEELKTKLDVSLKNAAAVVVVRTTELDDKPWVYEAVNAWANQHSDVPILFAKDPRKSFPKIEPANKFLWIPDDPKSLPWRLLQRAKARSEAWRSQATYNRAMVWNIFYLSLMCIYIGAIWINAKNNQLYTQKSGYDISMDAMDEAIETERSFRRYTSVKDDPSLSTSYWFRHRDKPYIFVTTEVPHNTTYFENGFHALISCGYAAYPNHVIEWSIKTNQPPAVYDNYDNKDLNSKCEMLKLGTSPIKSIVCATYNGTADPLKNSNSTVGICIFTENEDNNIFGSDYRKFLRVEVARYHSKYIGLIEQNKMISLDERELKAQPTH